MDGCTNVVLSGHDLGESATATIGGEELPIVAASEDPSREEWAQDVGFDYFGVTPAAPELTPGFYDVEMVVDGQTLTLPQAFYYRECPASFQIDSFSVSSAAGTEVTSSTPSLAPGDIFSLNGCGLGSAVQAQIVDFTGNTSATTATPAVVDACGNIGAVVETVPLVSDCGTANVHFAIPDTLADGDYAIWLTDGTTTDKGTYLTITYPTPSSYTYTTACAEFRFTVGGGT